jgi:hypothetical protein
LMQDDSKKLSKWFTNRPGAKHQLLLTYEKKSLTS